MPLCWPRAQPGLLPSPVTTPARTSGGRPHTASENSEVVQTRGWPAPGSGRVRLGLGDVREGFPAAGWPAAGGSALLDAGVNVNSGSELSDSALYFAVFSGCGGKQAKPTGTVLVSMADNSYSPAIVHIPAGGSVVFINAPPAVTEPSKTSGFSWARAA